MKRASLFNEVNDALAGAGFHRHAIRHSARANSVYVSGASQDRAPGALTFYRRALRAAGFVVVDVKPYDHAKVVALLVRRPVPFLCVHGHHHRSQQALDACEDRAS